MNEQEIKLELAKAALLGGVPEYDIQPLYEWVVKQNKTAKKKRRSRFASETPVEELTQRTEHPRAIADICHNHDITTLAHLIQCGGQRFSNFFDVPEDIVKEIDQAFKDWYNIQDWMNYGY